MHQIKDMEYPVNNPDAYLVERHLKDTVYFDPVKLRVTSEILRSVHYTDAKGNNSNDGIQEWDLLLVGDVPKYDSTSDELVAVLSDTHISPQFMLEKFQSKSRLVTTVKLCVTTIGKGYRHKNRKIHPLSLLNNNLHIYIYILK